VRGWGPGKSCSSSHTSVPGSYLDLIHPVSQVWSKNGTLLGKIFIGTTSANMAFAGDGRLMIMAETKIFMAKIAAKEGKVVYP